MSKKRANFFGCSQGGRAPSRSRRGPSKLPRRPRNVFPSLFLARSCASGTMRRENERCLVRSNSRRAAPGARRRARSGLRTVRGSGRKHLRLPFRLAALIRCHSRAGGNPESSIYGNAERNWVNGVGEDLEGFPRAAAGLLAPGTARRNSLAGLVTFSRRFFRHAPALRASGDGKTNDAWFGQTVDGPRPERDGALGADFGRCAVRAGNIFVCRFALPL